MERTCSDCLNQMDPNALAASSQVMEPGCTCVASRTNGRIRCGWLLTGRDQLCFDQISSVESDSFPFFFLLTHRVRPQLTVYHKSQHSLQHTMLKLFYPKWKKTKNIIRQQRQTVGTSKSLLLHDNASAHKTKTTVTFLKEQNIQVSGHPPYSPDLAKCDSVLPPRQRNAGWVEMFPQ